MHTLVVSPDPLGEGTGKLRSLMRNLVDSKGPQVATYDQAGDALAQFHAELIVVVLQGEPERGLQAMLELRRAGTFIVAVGGVQDSQLILRALQHGADHYVDQDNLKQEFEAALARLQIKQQFAPAGRVLAVLGSCGGTGASTVAVNVAATLAREHRRCALVDLNPGRGDLAALLDLKPQFNLADLCLNVSRMDRAIFEKMLAPHASGVHLLAAPRTFSDVRVVTPDGVSQALTMASSFFPFVVVDVEDCFHEEQAVALRQAATILLVARLDFTSLRNARRMLEHCGDLGISRTNIRIVINRYGQSCELPVAEAEDAMGEKLTHLIPDDAKTINTANNAGIPAVLNAPGAKVSKSLVQLAKAVGERRRETARELAGALR
jgi:pilus assembly protein CpaE